MYRSGIYFYRFKILQSLFLFYLIYYVSEYLKLNKDKTFFSLFLKFNKIISYIEEIGHERNPIYFKHTFQLLPL